MTTFLSLPAATALRRIGLLLFCIFLYLPFAVADVPLFDQLGLFQDGALGPEPNQTFFSSPLKAPIYQVNALNLSKIDPGRFIFITGGYNGFGPSIISAEDFSLVWADQAYNEAQACQTYTFKGQPVLGVHAGDAVRIYNQRYELLYRVVPQGDFYGTFSDNHEAHLTHDDTVAMIISRAEDIDLTSIGRPGVEPATNCHIQEVDPASNEVLFQFNMLDHFDPQNSFFPYDGPEPYQFGIPYDIWHVNSLEKTPEGDFLVSSRHLHSIFLIDGKTREVKWVLGGKRNQFRDITEGGGSAEFHWQHNARLLDGNRLTFFDNHDAHNGYCHRDGCSRGLEVEIDVEAMTVKMVNEWYHPQSLSTASRGGVQRLPSGNTLIAWGQNPMYTEHAPDGEVVMDIQRGQVLPLDHGIVPVIAYRSWKSDWVGMPQWPPAIALSKDELGTRIHVSWNGATEVTSYVLLLSNSLDNLNGRDAIAATSPRAGFETSFQLEDDVSFARIAALNSTDHIIGYTSAIDTIVGKYHQLEYPIDDLTTSTKSRARSGEASASAFGAIIIAVGFTL
ncbi:Arylsulfotransferase-domain-containing protein [Xylariomycetidae sp. FL2044]|nr:Arylsulfotransferase-domain-containing protein [Xylariomycetidae sp. FL2044]